MVPRMRELEDNVGALQSASNAVGMLNSKHTDVRHHALREFVAGGDVTIIRVNSECQYAECLTKKPLHHLERMILLVSQE